MKKFRLSGFISVTVVVLAIVVTIVAQFDDSPFAAHSPQAAAREGPAKIGGHITARMIADNPKKFVGRRVRLRCEIETFIDGPIEGPAAYASCSSSLDAMSQGLDAAFIVLRGDQFASLDVDDSLTVIGTVATMETATPMGRPRTFPVIDADGIEALKKRADGTEH